MFDQEIDTNANLAQALFHGVVSLEQPYHMSVAMEDLDKSINYCRIFTEMAESFLEMMVDYPNHVSIAYRYNEQKWKCISHVKLTWHQS